MTTRTGHADHFRRMAALFSPSTFRPVLTSIDTRSILRRIVSYTSNERHVRVATLLNRYYRSLTKTYRGEYIYKNSLLTQELLEKHTLEKTLVLNELRVGASLADFVLLNGEIRVFEIKSELDNFDKLSKQVEDYKRIANRVNVVVSESAISKVERMLAKSIGIIAFVGSSGLITIREAEVDNDGISREALFKILRKHEYLTLTETLFGEVPKVPNTLLFRRCLELMQQVETIELQNHVREILKQRQLRCPDLLISPRTPKSLKQVCYSLNPSRDEYDRLFSFLETKY